jgi:hypothetical protein
MSSIKKHAKKARNESRTYVNPAKQKLAQSDAGTAESDTKPKLEPEDRRPKAAKGL